MQTKLQLAIKDLEKYSTEKLCLELKEADLCEEVEKCISKCATKDVATFDDHVDGFNPQKQKKEKIKFDFLIINNKCNLYV